MLRQQPGQRQEARQCYVHETYAWKLLCVNVDLASDADENYKENCSKETAEYYCLAALSRRGRYPKTYDQKLIREMVPEYQYASMRTSWPIKRWTAPKPITISNAWIQKRKNQNYPARVVGKQIYHYKWCLDPAVQCGALKCLQHRISIWKPRTFLTHDCW